jgi:signal peptidase I
MQSNQSFKGEEDRKQGFGDLKHLSLAALDFLKVIVIALAIILPIRYYVFQPFIVSGSSMFPNFTDGQYLIIDELTYRFREPQRGEVVVLKDPYESKQYFIKRIVGLPGERVAIDNGRVSIYNNEFPGGLILDESYLPNQGLTFPLNSTVVGGKRILQLNHDEYFSLGDNRLASSDSRVWGPLNRGDIVGRVYVRALPLNQFQKFQPPSYSYR